MVNHCCTTHDPTRNAGKGTISPKALLLEWKPWHRRNDFDFDFPGIEQLPQPGVDKYPMTRLLSIGEQRRKGQDATHCGYAMPRSRKPGKKQDTKITSTGRQRGS